MSAGVVHAADGALQTLALIREDARAFLNDDSADLSPPCWSPGTEATPITPAALAAALQEAGVAGRKGEGDRLTATLVQEGLRDVTWASTRVGAAGDALFGGSSEQASQPAAQQAAAAPATAEACTVDKRAFYQCLETSNGDASRCQELFNQLSMCQENAKWQSA